MLLYFVWILLGLWLVAWILWRGIRTEIGLILLVFAGFWLLRQLLSQDTLHEINFALAVVLGVAACVVLIALLAQAIQFFKPPLPPLPPHPQPGDADYLDWANRRGKYADGPRP